jgi:hypothetical protein
MPPHHTSHSFGPVDMEIFKLCKHIVKPTASSLDASTRAISPTISPPPFMDAQLQPPLYRPINFLLGQCKCNEDLSTKAQRIHPSVHEQFMKLVNLKTLDISTAWCWQLLRFPYFENKKCYYIDSCQQANNVKYRLEFIKRYFKYEYHTYQWVQLLEEDVIWLFELFELEPLKKGLGQSYTDDQGNTMGEYHSNCHDALKYFIDLENLPFDANLSAINFPEGGQPLIFVSQDEAIIYQYLFDDWKEPAKKPSKELKKELVDKGIITASQSLDQKKLVELATLNSISLPKKLNNWISCRRLPLFGTSSWW